MLRKVYKNSNKIDIVLGTKLALVASDLEHKRSWRICLSGKSMQIHHISLGNERK